MTGIDFIAQRPSGRFWAIQCKYHQFEDASLSREEATGLIAGLNRARGAFELGLICTTVNGLMTATPRIYSGTDREHIVSMDNAAVYRLELTRRREGLMTERKKVFIAMRPSVMPAWPATFSRRPSSATPIDSPMPRNRHAPHSGRWFTPTFRTRCRSSSPNPEPGRRGSLTWQHFSARTIRCGLARDACLLHLRSRGRTARSVCVSYCYEKSPSC